MKFESGAERAAYYRERKKNKSKATKLKYYSKNATQINEKRKVQQVIHISNPAQRQRKSREMKELKRERNRMYQRTFKSKSKEAQGKHTFSNRMEKCRLLKKIKDIVPGSPNTQKKIFRSVITPEKCQPSEKSINDMIASNVKDMVTSLKRRRSDEARAALNILTASVSGENLQESRSGSKTAKSLGLRRSRVSHGLIRRNVYFRSEKACFTATTRKVRSDRISDATKQLIYDWWVSPASSRPTGNKADVKRLRTGYKTYTSHPTYIMEKTQSEIFEEFKAANSDIKVSQRYFERLRPFFVQQLRPKDRTTCCCRKHVEARLLFRKCNDFNRKTGRTHLLFDHLSDAVNTTMCPKPDGSQYHSIKCIRRTCADCGVNKSQLFTEPLLPESTVPVCWEKYEYVRVTVKGNSEKKKLMLVKKKTSPVELFEYFKEVLHSYTEHQFSAVWQHEQLAALKTNLPTGHCLVIHDFSENYRCIEKQELQSTYFGKTEVSVHVSVIYRHAVSEYDGMEENEVITELFYTISPDQTHDHYFVSHVQREIKRHLDMIGSNVDTMVEFTDGCSAQYKSKTCMGTSTYLCEQHGYNLFTRNYFETSHAKGPQDAAGGLLKRQLDQAVMKGHSIQGARDVFDYATQYLSSPKSGIYQRRIFAYADSIDRLNKMILNVIVCDK